MRSAPPLRRSRVRLYHAAAIVALVTPHSARAQACDDAGQSASVARAAPQAAQQAGGPDDDATTAPLQRTRRGGFTLALLAGAQIMSARGTPTKFEQRNDAFAVNTGAAGGYNTTLLLGITFNDYLGFHGGFESSRASRGGLRVSAPAFLLGFEAWPLFARGGALRDLGVSADFGTGGPAISRASDGAVLASAGASSFVRFGVFFEALHAGAFDAGPYVAYEHASSETYAQGAGSVGLRLAYQASR